VKKITRYMLKVKVEYPCGNLPHSDRQPNSFLRWHSHTDGQTPSITVKQTSKLLSVEQTPRSERWLLLYTAVCDLVACTPTQALANQRPQLQLRLHLACTLPSGNGIKLRASNRLASVTAVRSICRTSIITSSSALGESSSRQQPHLRGQQLYAP
jgi:hypothetical protein